MPNTDDMPEERQGFSPELYTIRGEEIIEFMSSFPKEPNCPMCDGDLALMAAGKYDDDNNQIGFEDRPAIIGVTVDEKPEIGITLKTPAFGATCNDCGFISYFMVGKFMAWKRKNEANKP